MGSYDVSRSTEVAADAATLHALINDFHGCVSWSPWEDLDPDLQRTYSGPDAGVGAHYAWSGNRKAGRGSMEITASSPRRIEVALTFQAPFASTSQVAFDLVPAGAGTTVTWSTGRCVDMVPPSRDGTLRLLPIADVTGATRAGGGRSIG